MLHDPFDCNGNERLESLLERIDRRIMVTLEQCERFDRMKALLEEWAANWGTDALIRTLQRQEVSEEMKEQALVGLVLQGTSRAREAIESYSPPSDSTAKHARFYDVARIEMNSGGAKSSVLPGSGSR